MKWEKSLGWSDFPNSSMISTKIRSMIKYNESSGVGFIKRPHPFLALLTNISVSSAVSSNDMVLASGFPPTEDLPVVDEDKMLP